MTDLDVVDMLVELTRPHTHAESYTVTTRPAGSAEVGVLPSTVWTRRHRTRVPSLIYQLQHASPSGEGLGRSGAYESRPVVRVEALDTLVRIDHAAARWVRDLGEDDPGTTEACVQLLGSLLVSADRCRRRSPARDRRCCTAHAIEADVRRWWAQARVATGWDTPPWRPDATCPVCGVRGGLRVRLEARSALCVECHETWDAGSYQALAEHVRVEADERRRQRLSTVVDVDAGSSQNRGW